MGLALHSRARRHSSAGARGPGRSHAAATSGTASILTALPVAMPRGYGSISSFGEDAAGNLYVLDHAHGTVHRLEGD